MNTSFSNPVGITDLVMTEQTRREFLSQIPSETSLAERVLLYELFKNAWDGEGKVVEIGPFLGGTTRAIAAGMMMNSRRAEGADLHTFDRFSDYHTPENLRKMMESMVQLKIFTASDADRLCATGSFLTLFRAIHEPQDYYKILHVHDSPMPDYPQEVNSSTALDCFNGETALGAVFIDGCKSWASTHYAMKYLLPRTRLNAPIIFQDFAWYTCYWISAFVYALRDYFTYEKHADSTYVFRLKQAVSEKEITKLFTTTPEAMGALFFQQADDYLFTQSQARNDNRGALIARLHHIAALASTQRLDAAAKILKSINPYDYKAHVDLIKGCLSSPTYRPCGKKILWTDKN